VFDFALSYCCVFEKIDEVALRCKWPFSTDLNSRFVLARSRLVSRLETRRRVDADRLELEPPARVEDEPEDDDRDHGNGDAFQPVRPESRHK
jgi:hypothetical protein